MKKVAQLAKSRDGRSRILIMVRHVRSWGSPGVGKIPTNWLSIAGRPTPMTFNRAPGRKHRQVRGDRRGVGTRDATGKKVPDLNRRKQGKSTCHIVVQGNQRLAPPDGLRRERHGTQASKNWLVRAISQSLKSKEPSMTSPPAKKLTFCQKLVGG